MRAIDADVIIKDLTAMQSVYDAISLDGMIKALQNAPTIDPESLRPQGEWVDKPSGRYGAWQSWCSVCGKHSGIGGIESNRHKPYCPNCGARMIKDGAAHEHL